MERDKFLTEAMGYGSVHITELGEIFGTKVGSIDQGRYSIAGHKGFSTWQGFGKLWEWAQEQEWWRKFGGSVYEDTYDSDPKYKTPICELEYFINPDRFAEAVYEFLNSEEGKRR